MRGAFLALLLGAITPGCGGDSMTERGGEPAALTITEDEISRYLEWWRTRNDLVRKHLRETSELQERLDQKYSLADLHKVQQDPELIDLMKRQREEIAAHQANKPIAHEKANGFDSVLAGLGRWGHRHGRMVYEIEYDRAALQGARDKYGEAFVAKVLARERDIAAAMTP